MQTLNQVVLTGSHLYHRPPTGSAYLLPPPFNVFGVFCGGPGQFCILNLAFCPSKSPAISHISPDFVCLHFHHNRSAPPSTRSPRRCVAKSPALLLSTQVVEITNSNLQPSQAKLSHPPEKHAQSTKKHIPTGHRSSCSRPSFPHVTTSQFRQVACPLSDNYHITLAAKTTPTFLICRNLRNFPFTLSKNDFHIILTASLPTAADITSEHPGKTL